jgi:DNA helicase-2/ATP-dependent DNA helicase PcrA
MKDYLKELNANQLEAVSDQAQYIRIIAGAGSGKTRVLTYRIAYLIENYHILPGQILAITFTNKVANEMKERATNLVAEYLQKPLEIMTYHKFCAMFLRREISVLNFPRSYAIFDDDDQLKLIKDIAESKGYSRGDKFVDVVLDYISYHKGKGEYPADINTNKLDLRFPDAKKCLEFYKEYEAQKSANFCLDFDDLILKTIQILENYPDIRTKWSKYYKHVLIDEFQDTNDLEFKLVKLLLNADTSLYVVGDPDQTIYTWRGANQKIILDLNNSFPTLKTIVLDLNYRSTKEILKVANALISNNKYRVEKNLVTDNEKGNPVAAKILQTRVEEATWVADKIRYLNSTNSDFHYSDVAVLYRSNYLSSPFENIFTRYRIPYVIYGGLRFYQRKEIKDVISYLRLIINPDDDFAYTRIVNEPKRGCGETSLNYLKSEALAQHMSLFKYIENISNFTSEVAPRIVRALIALNEKIKRAQKRYLEGLEAISQIIDDYVSDIGYYDYLETLEEGDDKIANVKQLMDDIKDYFKNEQEATLNLFLENVALQSAQDEVKNNDVVKFMTIHVGKGLEFKYVFVVGMNEGVFPSQRTVMESPIYGMEEERRLCYVAFTRARKELFITANNDYSYTNGNYATKSRFIDEAGITPKKEYSSTKIFENTPRKAGFIDKTNNSVFTAKNDKIQVIDWHVGDLCRHKVFGEGEVIEVKGDIIKIDFHEGLGVKSIISTHPALSKVEVKTGKA